MNLDTLLTVCENPDLDDNDVFRDLIYSFMIIFRLSPDDLASMFDVSTPSVRRWAEGVNAPRRIVRRYAYKRMGEVAKELS
jgi:hypothetical protein